MRDANRAMANHNSDLNTSLTEHCEAKSVSKDGETRVWIQCVCVFVYVETTHTSLSICICLVQDGAACARVQNVILTPEMLDTHASSMLLSFLSCIAVCCVCTELNGNF